jgi:hypothetical protein
MSRRRPERWVGTCRGSRLTARPPIRVAANPSLNFDAVHPAYFSTLGVSILRGRAFTANDRAGQPPVAIVSDALAAAVWPGQDAIGKRLKYGGPESRNEWLTVIGVAATTRYRELTAPRPTLYVPAEQMFISFGWLAVRTTADPAIVTGCLRELVRDVDHVVRVRRVPRYPRVPRGTAGVAALQHTAAHDLRDVRAVVVGDRTLRRDGGIGAPAAG